MTDEYRFGRYLLRELLWELDQFDITVAGLTDAPPEQINIVSFVGYDTVRIRTALATASPLIEARLSWRSDAAPILSKIP